MDIMSQGIGLISVILFIFCFYFTLTFIEHIIKGDKRISKQSKIAAIICLALGLLFSLIL